MDQRSDIFALFLVRKEAWVILPVYECIYLNFADIPKLGRNLHYAKRGFWSETRNR